MAKSTQQIRASEDGSLLLHAAARAKAECSGRETTYWGIHCRTCREIVAFDSCPYATFGPYAAHMHPGAICCGSGHNHIYFPRDFQFIVSAVLIAPAVMLQNREAYRAINPPQLDPVLRATWRPPTPALHPVPPAAPPLRLEPPLPPRAAANPARKSAMAAARIRWATWAIKKSM
jgi:hypothetical protein